MKVQRISLPLTREKRRRLKAGDVVLLSGVIVTARDQAHGRLKEATKHPRTLARILGAGLFRDLVIYYCGPTRTPAGKTIGSCGPTTSSRMDPFTPALLKSGVAGMIGKGARSEAVRQAIKKYRAVYFLTYAGCGALLSRYVQKAKRGAYRDLGPEALHWLTVKDFPVIVGIDSQGRSVYGTHRR